MNRIARIGGRFIYRGFRTVPDSEVRFYAPWNKALAGSWNESSAELQGNKEKKRGEREEKRGIVFCSLDVDARLVRSFTLSRCIRTRFRGRKERDRKKKKFLRLCTLFTQIYDRRLRHRWNFHADGSPTNISYRDLPVSAYSRPRNIFSSPYEQMNELHLSYLQRALEPMPGDDLSENRSAPLPSCICYINLVTLYTLWYREFFTMGCFPLLRISTRSTRRNIYRKDFW